MMRELTEKEVDAAVSFFHEVMDHKPAKCCETCRYDLGGGYNNCRINLEYECASGDYEAWEPKEE